MNAELPTTIMNPPSATPSGYMRNPYGDLVPADLVAARIKLEDQAVRTLIGSATALREAMAAFKASALADIDALLDLLAQQYKTSRRGRRGGVELIAFDGCMKVSVTVADTIDLGPEINIAKELIDGCIARWSDGADSNLKAVVENAFRVGQGGKLAVEAILRLRQVRITDADWQRAMLAIGDAMRATASKSYVRFYTRPAPDAKWVQVALDFAGV
jgi:hypothetical protein